MLKERMNILQQAAVISQEISDFVKEIIDLLEPRFPEKESGMEMFTTHLAMATQRILSNDEVENLDDMIWNEICVSPYFSKAEKTYQEIVKNAPCEYPEGERKFLIMHLCNLYQE